MPRPITISTEHIVECARAQFLANGFAVRTSEIASAAGISEGTIFKRFPTKVALFKAAMGLPEPSFLEELPDRVGLGEIHEQLMTLGTDIYDFYSDLMPRVMITISKGGNFDPVFSDESCAPPPILVIQGVMGYLEAEQEAGRLCCKHPELAARMFVGTIVHSCVLNLRIPNSGEHIITQRETVLEHLVDTFLQGVGP